MADAGGLSMAIPLLSSDDAQTQANAASLCEVFASLEQGARVILSSGGLPQLVGLVRAAKVRPTPASAPAAGALVALLSAGDESQQAVMAAGGLEGAAWTAEQHGPGACAAAGGGTVFHCERYTVAAVTVIADFAAHASH